MLDHSAQSGRHSLAERGNDCYSTPAVAVDALLTVESLPYRIWEPATGHGNIVRALRDAGHVVIASDVMHYTFPLDFAADFLEQMRAPAGTELILTNPPYKHATGECRAISPANAAAAVGPMAAAKPKMRTTKRGITRIDTNVVAEPTLREELNDDLPDSLK